MLSSQILYKPINTQSYVIVFTIELYDDIMKHVYYHIQHHINYHYYYYYHGDYYNYYLRAIYKYLLSFPQHFTNTDFKMNHLYFI